MEMWMVFAEPVTMISMYVRMYVAIHNWYLECGEYKQCIMHFK